MALVAMAEPEQTGELCDGTGFECLADPSQGSYKTFDIRRGGLKSVAYSDPAGPDATRLVWAFAEKQFKAVA